MYPVANISKAILCLWVVVVAQVAWGAAQEPSPQSPQVAIGFQSHAKLGHWLPVTFEFAEPTPAKTFQITTLDGEDTPVTTSGPLWQVSPDANTFQALVQFGRTYGDLKIELLDGAGEVCFVDTVVLQKKATGRLQLLPSTTPLVVCIEPKRNRSPGASIAALYPKTGSDERTRVVVLNETGNLPVVREGWSSCESVVLVVDDESFVESFPAKVAQSLCDWVRHGGHVFVVSSPSVALKAANADHWKALFPGKVTGGVDIESTRRRIEDFSGSNNPLIKRGEKLTVVGIEEPTGRVVLEQDDVPLIIRSPLGLGELTFVTINTKGEKFLSWDGSAQFLQNAFSLRSGTRERKQSEVRAGTSVRHSGYKDLLGQLKVPLDSFSKLGFIPFAVIATLVALYVICIGPGDWFLVGKVLKKHELTWITFPLITLLFCGLAWYIASLNRPTDIQINQLEVIDIDSVSGEVRGTVWANLFNPDTRTVNPGLRQVGMGEDIGAVRSRVSWLGLPGTGLGGMRNRANPGLFRNGYQQTWSRDAVELSTGGLELQVSSTRPVLMEFDGRYTGKANSRLTVDDRLQGTFTNPFDQPLKNCMLFFDGYVYLVRGTLGAEETVDIFSEMTEKDARSYLTRQRISDSDSGIKSQSVPWDPTSDRIDRIALMMMFHRSAGGKSYTNMSNQFHEFIDMTPTAQLDRAVLVGTLLERVTEFEIDSQPVSDLYDQSLTMVRVVLPVERENRKR